MTEPYPNIISTFLYKSDPNPRVSIGPIGFGSGYPPSNTGTAFRNVVKKERTQPNTETRKSHRPRITVDNCHACKLQRIGSCCPETILLSSVLFAMHFSIWLCLHTSVYTHKCVLKYMCIHDSDSVQVYDSGGMLFLHFYYSS